MLRGEKGLWDGIQRFERQLKGQLGEQSGRIACRCEGQPIRWKMHLESTGREGDENRRFSLQKLPVPATRPRQVRL